MEEMMRSIRRSLESLGRGKVWLYILAPALIAGLFMIGVSVALLEYLVSSFIAAPPMTWIADWGVQWLAKALAVLGAWMLILSASYLVAMIMTAVLILPLMLNYLSEADYPDLARLGENSFVASTWNSVWAALLFLVGWVVTLPLWLIPGLGLLLPLFWMAWLNRKTFAYDALSVHATSDEWRTFRKEKAMPLLILGFVTAALAHVPLVGMLAPSLSALTYLHFCLAALRRSRKGAVVCIEPARG